MLIIIIVSLISVFLTYLSKYRETRYCFEIAILSLIIFWGFRYNFGNDYAVYLANFDSIKNYSEGIIELESGWVLLNRIFSYGEFPSLVFFITIIQFYSIYFYLKHYVEVKYRWFVLLFYIINASLMIHSLSGLRQTVAMSIFIFSLHYIYNRKYLPSLLLLLIAAQFHSSAYLMLVLPFTIFLSRIKKKSYVYMLIAIFIICFFFRGFVLRLSSALLQFDEISKYDLYLTQSDSQYGGKGFGIMLQMLVLCILLVYDKHEDTMQNWLLKLYQMSFVFIPLYTILPTFARLQMYFMLLGIGGVPMLIKTAKASMLNAVIIVLFLMMILLGFSSALSYDSYSSYNTIFSSNLYL